MSKKTLIIVAHPNIEQSRVNQALKSAIEHAENVTVHELYKQYPNFKINVEKEQKLLMEHDNIVLQFPLFWYSVPPLLKQWLDSTFTYGFSHGVGGDKLKGKNLQVVTSTAMSQKHYSPILWTEEDKEHLLANTTGGSEGLNKGDKPYMKPSLSQRHGLFITDALLTHLEQSAYHTSMNWLPPFIVHSSIPEGRAFHALSGENLEKKCKTYISLVNNLNQ